MNVQPCQFPYYVIEGSDGSGKGAVTTRLMQWLETLPLAALRVTEPSEGRLGQAIRDQLEGRKPSLPALMLQLLFVFDRHEHLNENVLPALRAGKAVLSDRSALSTIVYGTVYTGRDIPTFLSMHEDVFGDTFLSPRLTFLLEVTEVEARARMARRGLAVQTTETRLGQVIEVYGQAAHHHDVAALTGPIRFVDANVTQEKVAEQVRLVIQSDLQRLGLLNERS